MIIIDPKWRRRTRILCALVAILMIGALGIGQAGADHGEEEAQARHGLDVGGSGSDEMPIPPGYTQLGFDIPEPGSYRLPRIKEAPTGEVLLESGEAANLADLFDERFVLLSFIYTSCNDVHGCPLATFVMDRLHQRIQEDETFDGRVRFLTLSFDPVNDTPEVMSSYRKNFTADGKEWKFLTTDSKSSLEPIIDSYGQSINLIYDEEGHSTGHFSHVLRVYLIDTKKQIRNIYNVDFLHHELLLTDIRTLMKEEDSDNGISAERERDVATSLPLGDLLIQEARNAPLGLPDLPEAKVDDLKPERVNLGRDLFRDRRLSSNGALACASCHNPREGFTQNSTGRAVGIEGKSLRRNSSSLLNVAYQDRFFWDGREFSLDSLVWTKLLDETALGNTAVGEVLKRLRDDSNLEAAFDVAFDGKGITMESVASALSSYLTTLVSGNSRFDQWYFGDAEEMLTAEEEVGFDLFRGRAGCIACHTMKNDHALFMDQSLHNTGLGWEHSQGLRARRDTLEVGGRTIKLNLDALSGTEARRYNDLGLYEVTQDPDDRWRFRTPTLRDVEITGPYMHDGSISTLEDVVRYYNKGGVPHALQDETIQPLGLNATEKSALVSFLKSLTGQHIDNHP